MEDAAQSNVTPLGLLFIVTMGVLTFTLSRRYAVMPLLITTAYMPLGQMFVVAGLHLQFFRVLLILGVFRVIAKKESADFTMTPLDRVFIGWGIAGVILGTLAECEWERFVNRAGEGFNAFTAYFLFRCWVRSLEDTIQTVKLLALLIVPIGISMIVEKFTTRNIFAVFGGVPEVTSLREGKLRCQGAFRHPILAGTYAATFFPLIAGLWFQPRVKKWIPVLGMFGALVIAAAASSSGAILATMTGIIGLVLWTMRAKMRAVRWGILGTIFALAVVMKAPVWYLPAKISELMGGTGWHRSYLIDQAIIHFNEWWMVGSAYTASWAPGGDQILVADPKNMDITNNYIAEGLGGGLVKLGLFIVMIVLSYKFVGRWTKESMASPFSRSMFVWSMGVCLTGHCVSFLSIAYYDQIVVMWYWLLASMAMLCVIRERTWDMFPPESVSAAGLGEPVGAGQN